MRHHWHLVVWPREDGELSQFVGWLTLTPTQRWHAHRQSTGSGHVDQGRFKSFPLQDDDHLFTVARYAERHARRGNLVRRAEQRCRFQAETANRAIALHFGAVRTAALHAAPQGGQFGLGLGGVYRRHPIGRARHGPRGRLNDACRSPASRGSVSPPRALFEVGFSFCTGRWRKLRARVQKMAADAVMRLQQFSGRTILRRPLLTRSL